MAVFVPIAAAPPFWHTPQAFLYFFPGFFATVRPGSSQLKILAIPHQHRFIEYRQLQCCTACRSIQYPTGIVLRVPFAWPKAITCSVTGKKENLNPDLIFFVGKNNASIFVY
ncbi:MAG TPA: hypothetical protein VHK69_13595 [Chitinophagaceae bacterium]|jgi:hypothetical protein|nr:hypothetical protein [Chitinophagaceae bacterium]